MATTASPQSDYSEGPSVELPPSLSSLDLAAFSRLGISPELLAKAHVQRLTDQQAREYGIKGSLTSDMSGVIFPYFDPTTGQRVTARLRRDNPEVEDGNSKNKYISAYADRRHLYFVPGSGNLHLDTAVPVVLVEAEKTTLALTAWAERMGMELLVVGLGGCWGWRGRIGKAENANGQRVDEVGPLPDLHYCDGRKVYVLLDSNISINSKVQQAQRALVYELLRRNCEVLICTLPRTPGVNGPDDYIAAFGDEAMAAVLASAIAGECCWVDPVPLGGELPAVLQFETSLLPELLRPLVEDAAERMQVPIDFPAIVMLLSLAGIMNRRATIQPKASDTSWVVVPNLWGAIIAPPGWMKSPVIAAITRPLTQLEKLWRVEHEAALADYEQQKEEADLQQQAWREQYKAAQKKAKPAPIRPDSSICQPAPRRLITHDATAEKLHEILRDNPAGVLLIRDELSSWLATLDKPGKEGERGFFLSAWNGDFAYTMDRIGRGSIHVDACCVSVLGGIQPGRLRGYLADALADGPANDGLLQRFQLLVYPDPPNDWQYVDRAPRADIVVPVQELFERIASWDPSDPHRFRFSPDAQELFVAFLTELEGKLRSTDLHPAMVSHLAKYRSLMPALALLFEIGDGGTESVSLRHAQQAAAFCDYLESHARRVYSMIISPERQAAAELGRHFKEGWKRAEGMFTVRDVYHNDWRGLESPDAVRRAISLLEDANWVRPVRRERPEGGRPCEQYAINPRIWSTT
jgi:putative DNA primase/helicase